MRNSIFIFIILSTISSYAEDYYYPKTDIFSVSSGIYYDNPVKINSMLKKILKTDYLPSNVYFLSLNYKFNHNPIISNKPYLLLYSFNIQLPITRRTTNVSYNAELQTYSASFELSVFESYIKTVTVHPVVGLGYSYTELIMPIKFNSDFGINDLDDKLNKYEKSNLNLIIGGGCDLRLNLRESEQETKYILLSFEAKYSINLDVLNIVNSDWKVGSSKALGLPDYTAPGLSIELKLGIENQRR